MTNLEIAEQLRRVAAAYQILGENRFKIIAYEKAADSVEHLTSELKDYWDDKKLHDVPGIGAAMAGHLDELFRTGKVTHWESVLAKVPAAVFPLLRVPGLGPKKAYKLVVELGLTNPKTVFADIQKAAKAGKIAPIEGFGEKSQIGVLGGIETYKKGQIKENRMPLPFADNIAREVIEYLTSHKAVKRVDALGSLRRNVSTIGDIDLAVATLDPQAVLEYFLAYPHQKVVEKGPSGATLLLHNGRQLDLRVQRPQAYGAMLQYFTGGKNHNIKLREYALDQGLSLNEHGIKSVKTGKVKEYATEEDFYHAVGLAYIPPELREDKGEVEAALRTAQGKPNGLPNVVQLKNIRGDLHIHTSYDFGTSHDLGRNSLGEYLDKAADLGYEYIGISDHNPSLSNRNQEEIISVMKRRKEKYEQLYSSWKNRERKRIQYFLMCEVDILPDGKLALPEKAFEYVDAVIVSLHSAFGQDKKTVTARIIKALSTNPKVRIFGHPTGRLLGSREGVDADWPEVFAVAKQRDVALEINAFPERLDLPDSLVFDARKMGLRFCVDTDAHAVEHMDLARYGVSVARRAWCTAHDIVNTLAYNEFTQWLLRE